jgi:hypothetical protein
MQARSPFFSTALLPKNDFPVAGFELGPSVPEANAMPLRRASREWFKLVH